MQDNPDAGISTPPREVHHHHYAAKSGAVAALLEILPGMFLQTFGIGHIYAGNVLTGLLFMFGYWIVAFVNFLLVFVVVGMFTWPLCWVVTAIVSTVIAANSVKPVTAISVQQEYR